MKTDSYCGNYEIDMASIQGVPSRVECLHLMKQYHMWDNIFQHSLKVAQVALFLTKALNRIGERLDLGLVEAASLLHDITKRSGIENKEDHVATGAALLRDLGYDKVAEVVAYHVHLPKKRDPSKLTEAEIVNYADKRVLHDSIVTLEERFSDIKVRYGKNKHMLHRINSLERETAALEKKIFSKLNIKPDDLEKLV